MNHPELSTTDRIIMTTLNLIAEQGLGSITMIEIARSAGVARQTLYNHYPDVDSIVADAISRHNHESINQLRAAVAVVDTPTAQIEQLVRHVAQISTHQGHTIDSDYGLGPDHRAALDDYNQALDDLISGIIANGQQSNEFRPDLDPGHDSTLVRYQLAGISNLVNARPDNAPSITRTGTRTILATLNDHEPDTTNTR